MRQMFGIFILCILFVFGIRPGFGAVSAQAETPVEAPALPLVDVNAAGEQIVGVINGIVTGGVNAAWFAPIVVLIVGLLKSVPFLYKDSPDDRSGVSAPTLSFGVSAIIWIISALVTKAGFTAQFNSLMDLIVQTSPYIFGFLATLGIAPKVHEYAASVKAPILGSKRSPEPATLEAIPGEVLATIQPIQTPMDEAAVLRLANQAAVIALERVGFNWKPKDDTAAG